jgi:hypothetical protein
MKATRRNMMMKRRIEDKAETRMNLMLDIGKGIISWNGSTKKR